MTAEEAKRGGYMVCQDHFRPKDLHFKGQRTRLAPGAVPVLFTPQVTPVETKRAVNIPTDTMEGPEEQAGTSVDLEPVLQRKEKEIARLKKLLRRERLKFRQYRYRVSLKINKLQQSYAQRRRESCDPATNALPRQAEHFVRHQIALAGVGNHGQRYPKHIKSVALRMYHYSPRCYAELRGIFQLPSTITLQRHIKASLGNFEPGFLDGVLGKIKAKTSTLSNRERMCAIVLDEMSVKPHLDFNIRLDAIDGLTSCGRPATQAMVFMARGICAKWKQAIAYFLCDGTMASNNIAARLVEAIQLLDSVGLEVKCVVCDQGSTNVRAMKDLGASLKVDQHGEDSHCLQLVRNIPLIFDVPHLFKSVRNNLKKHPIRIEGTEVCWRHIEGFYLEDKKSTIRMAPKLTDKHLDLPPFMNMRVKLATQVFSHSVAAGMKTMVLNGTLEEEALNTANFVERLDRLFDVLNSRSLKDQKYWRRPLTGNSSRLDYLQSSLGWVTTWKFGSRRTPLCHAGLVTTIRSILKLQRDLQCDGITILCTAKLNQDCLENLFSVIRGKGGHRFHPTTREFTAALRSASVAGLFQMQGSGTNCLPDDGTPLVNQGERSREQDEATQQTQPDTWATEEGIMTGDNLLDGEEEALDYVAGWVCKKLGEEPELGQCWECDSVLTAHNNSEHSYSTAMREGSFLRNKQYSSTAGLCNPSDAVRLAVRRCEGAIKKALPRVWGRRGVTKALQEAIKDEGAFQAILLAHPAHGKVIERVACKKFVMCRVGAELRRTNEEVHTRKRRAQRKLVCLNASE